MSTPAEDGPLRLGPEAVAAAPGPRLNGSQGFRPYSARKPKDGAEGAGGPAGDAGSPRGGASSTYLSTGMLNGGQHQHQQPHGGEAVQGAANSHDPHDRNRSVSSAPRGPAAQVSAVAGAQQKQQQQQQQPPPPSSAQQPLPSASPAGLSHFTAGFPPGPQRNLMGQLPWFAQLQNVQLQGGNGLGNSLGGGSLSSLGGGSIGGGLSGMPGSSGQPNGEQFAAAMAAASGGRFRSMSFPADAHARLASLSSQPSAGSARPKRKSTLAMQQADMDTGYEDAELDAPGRFDSMGMTGEDGELAEEEEEEDAESRTRRRLAQNREAARKSRQRRKQYVARLEAEVRQLRWQAQQAGKGGAAGGGVPPSGARAASAAGRPAAGSPAKGGRVIPDGQPDVSPGAAAAAAALGADAAASEAAMGDLAASGGHVEILAAFARWRAEHASTTRAVRAALQGGPAQEPQLRTLADEARSQLWGLFQMKRAVVYSEGVGLIAGLAHLPPSERPFAWLGSGPLRPSDAAGGLLERLGSPRGGDGRAAMQLQILKESLAQQESMLTQGYDSVMAELRRHAAQAAGGPPQGGHAAAAAGSGSGGGAWSSPEVLGRLDVLRTLLLQADGLWQQFLEETQRSLPLAQAAQAAIACAEASAQLSSLGGPWAPLPGGRPPLQQPAASRKVEAGSGGGGAENMAQQK